MWILVYIGSGNSNPNYWYGSPPNNHRFWGPDKSMAKPIDKAELDLMHLQHEWMNTLKDFLYTEPLTKKE